MKYKRIFRHDISSEQERLIGQNVGIIYEKKSKKFAKPQVWTQKADLNFNGRIPSQNSMLLLWKILVLVRLLLI